MGLKPLFKINVHQFYFNFLTLSIKLWLWQLHVKASQLAATHTQRPLSPQPLMQTFFVVFFWSHLCMSI